MAEIKLFGQKIVLQVKQEKSQQQNDDDQQQDYDNQQSKSNNNNNNNNDNNNDNINNKRPDKIIPCPRCKSMETKFCYFNNYNVNQPRHFCKGCQRYWTAGGALRNVPIGAGRRKAKPPGHHGGGGGGLFSDDGCMIDGMDMGHFDMINNNNNNNNSNNNNRSIIMDEWQLAAAMAAGGAFSHGFQVKRRRSESTGQTC